jgi:uncharacterized membrane protein
VQNVTLIAATMTTGLIAGLFFAYANNVMPALRDADDRAFVDVMQRINVVILNPLFLSTYVGGLLISAAAAVAVWSGDDRGSLPWVVAGVVLYLAMFAITRAVNIPLNDQLAAAGDDAHATRERFEATWVTWNLVRAVLSAGAFGCLTVALLAQQ